MENSCKPQEETKVAASCKARQKQRQAVRRKLQGEALKLETLGVRGNRGKKECRIQNSGVRMGGQLQASSCRLQVTGGKE